MSMNKHVTLAVAITFLLSVAGAVAGEPEGDLRTALLLEKYEKERVAALTALTALTALNKRYIAQFEARKKELMEAAALAAGLEAANVALATAGDEVVGKWEMTWSHTSRTTSYEFHPDGTLTYLTGSKVISGTGERKDEEIRIHQTAGGDRRAKIVLGGRLSLTMNGSKYRARGTRIE